MALTVTTDLTVITTAEVITGWSAFGAQSPAIEPDFFAQGANCVSRALSGVVIKGMTFDIGAGGVLNFSTTHAGKLVYIWMRCSTPALADTRANGGVRILLGSGATAPGAAAGVWTAYYVDGSDTIAGTDGWKCYIIDPRVTASTTFGGGVDLTAIRWFGGVMSCLATAKGQNFGIDQISYGFGELRCSGTNTIVGAGFKEMSDADFGTIGNRYGIVVEKEGIFFVQGRLVIGDSVSTNATTFTTQNETLAWNYPVYWDGTRERPCMNDVRDDGTPYFGIYLVGNGTGNTDVTFGVKVGTGDTAKGRSGSTFLGSRHPTNFDGDDTAVENVLIYGSTFSRFRGGIDLSANASTDEFIGNTVSQSGSLQAGPCILRNNFFVSNIGGASKTFEDFINVRAAGAETLAVADPKYVWGNVVGGTQLSIPTASAGYCEVLDPGAGDLRNVTIIEADVVGSDDHYAEAVLRWPSAGALQSAMGVVIRKHATLATEDYWYLKVDIVAQAISLISCTAGTDTVQVGPTAMTIAEDTDYLVHLRGNGTTLEGFVNGTKLTVVSATHQTNRRVGIRADAEADQTGDAPRISQFGAGPNTDVLGAVRMPVTASQNVKNCSFINNLRATSITDVATHAYAGHSFSGNMVGLRNTSGGLVTVNVTAGDSPSPSENTGASSTTINNTVTYTITNLVATSEVRIFKTSDDSALAGIESSGTSFAYAYTYVSDTPVYIVLQKETYEWIKYNDTLTSSSVSQKVFQRFDRNYDNPA